MKITEYILFIWVFFTCNILNAQSFAGTYTISSQQGNISLTLQQSSGNQYLGQFLLANGQALNVQGINEGSDLTGTITNNQGGALLFEAYMEQQQLYLTIVPLDNQGQAIYNNASQYVLQRVGTSATETQPNLSQNNPYPQTQSTTGNSGFGGPLAQNATPSGFAGNYLGNLNGVQANMNLQQQGNQLSGTINAGGYMYQLQGTVQGNNSQGQILDPQTQGQMSYQAMLNGNTINMTLTTQNPYSGQPQQLSLQFQKGNSTQQNPNNAYNQSQSTAGNQGNNYAERDQRLVGIWSRSESYNSGDFGFATQESMQVLADGTYLVGDSRVIGGGPGITGDTGNSNGVSARGQWKTQGNIIYISEGAGWQPFARYYVEGYKMMLTFGDGTKQVWSRQ